MFTLIALKKVILFLRISKKNSNFAPDFERTSNYYH